MTTEATLEDRERLMDLIIIDLLSGTRARLRDSDLTAAEARLVWLRIIYRMLESIALEAKTDVLKEQFQKETSPR